jgi:hypothetical protein
MYNERAKSYSERVWRTREARFQASRRLGFSEDFSNMALIILSFANAVGSLWALYHKGNLSDQLSFVASVFSISVLVLSVREASRNMKVRAERLHRNAVDLSAIMDKMNYYLEEGFGRAEQRQRFENLISEYNSVIMACPENHDPIDDEISTLAYEVRAIRKSKDFSLWAYIQKGFPLFWARIKGWKSEIPIIVLVILNIFALIKMTLF